MSRRTYVRSGLAAFAFTSKLGGGLKMLAPFLLGEWEKFMRKKMKPNKKTGTRRKTRTRRRARTVSERVVRRSIITYIARQGWGLNLRERETHEHGVDIRVRHNRDARYFLIETKGESSGQSAADSSFVTCLGQIVTRMNVMARYRYGLGFPESVAKIAIRRIPWQVAMRLGLSVFSVNSQGRVREYKWRNFTNRPGR